MRLTEGTPNLMQRLASLPALPHLDPLLKGKLVPFSFCHKHHLLKSNSYQMVLHRPVETTSDFGTLRLFQPDPTGRRFPVAQNADSRA
jgi:hypothetical protein